MNQKDSVVYSGWMVKSPPEKKLHGAWKIFRAKWKRRFFVLSKPASSLPGQYLLNYYTDESYRRRKGQIDLEQCEQIIESLASEQFKYLLSIKTYHKHKDRTYFLATDTEDDMSTWVHYLCSVCGLKQEDKPHDIPPLQPTDSSQPIPVNQNSQHAVLNQPIPLQSPPASTGTTSPQFSQTNDSDNSPYLYLNQCQTGKSVKRRESSSSIPEEPAPTPPGKEGGRGGNLATITDDFDPHSTYDIPRPRDSIDDGLYKVPPQRSPGQRGETHKYDIPPYQKGASPRSSSSESQTGDSAYSSDQMYQSPPPPRQYSPTSEPYDSPPPPRKIFPGAPDRPPRSVMNSTRNSKPVSLLDKVPSNQGRDVRDEIYDIPPFAVESVLALSPPPPSCPNSVHRYVNANAAPLDPPLEPQRSSDDLYLPMGVTSPPQKCGSKKGPSSNEHSYLNMDSVPPTRSSTQSTGSNVYADMTNPGKDVYADMSTGRCSVYQTPPTFPRPVPTPASDAPVPPPRPGHSLGLKSNPDEDTYTIFSSERTRSFKRSSAGKKDLENHVPKVSPRPHVPLPSKQGMNHHHGIDSSSCSDDDDDDDDDRSLDLSSHSQQSGSSGIWRQTPPAPRKNEPELKYLDLDLDELIDKEAVKNPSIGMVTEYREIDFVKTQALSDTKRFVDVQRKSNSENLQ